LHASFQSTDVIYEFQLDTGPSRIENAGNGAFLTFLGAWRVKKKTEVNLLPGRMCGIEGIVRGFPVSLEIKGEGFCSCLMEELCDDDDDYYEDAKDNLSEVGSTATGSVVQGKRCMTLPPLYPGEKSVVQCARDHFGLAHNYGLDDYEANDNVSFSSEDLGSIDLGLYAPFVRSDRKYQSISDIKNFLFSGLPSSYHFEFDEIVDVVRHRKQVADITDDLTGFPHQIARSNVAMYINETGGRTDLKQTVWAVDQGNDGIHYLFHTKNIGKMKKGDAIELLICYSSSYDEVRGRRGYGKKQSVKSDSHYPTFLERQFVERFNMTEEILVRIHICSRLSIYCKNRASLMNVCCLSFSERNA
jgi:hypothetical protein